MCYIMSKCIRLTDDLSKPAEEMVLVRITGTSEFPSTSRARIETSDGGGYYKVPES